jgi:hypothetical protein
MIGELELELISGASERLRAWVLDTLSILSLNTRFLSKILDSAQFALENASQAVPDRKIDSIHLLIFAPPKGLSATQTWGFFRIEKMKPPQTDSQIHSIVIEFYLYLEGA